MPAHFLHKCIQLGEPFVELPFQGSDAARQSVHIAAQIDDFYRDAVQRRFLPLEPFNKTINSRFVTVG